MTRRFYLNPLLFLFLCSAALHCACAARQPVAATVVRPTEDSAERLRSDLERIFSDPAFDTAQWGVEVLSLDEGQLLYGHNAFRLYMPASNNKLLTSVASLVRLGPDYRFETQLLTDGDVSAGVLRGNLVISGSGDPTLAPRFHAGDPFAVFKEWAARFKEKGLRRIEGDLVGEDGAFEPNQLGMGWAWDDLPYGYAAPISPLQFNENLLSVEITPSEKEGQPAGFKVLPLPRYATLDCRVNTAASGSEANLDLERGETGESITLKGSIPAKSEPTIRTVAVRYPTLYYLQALKQTLMNEGVDVSKCGVKATAEKRNTAGALRMLFSYSSPPLAEILKPLLKTSQNLYAETLVRALGLAVKQEGSFDRGKEVIEEALGEMAIEKGTYSYVDGSGLSRLNLVSADQLVRVFKYMYRHRYFSEFYDALPIGGVDGTISERMKGTRAENNVRAKTGTLSHVRSLSGYVRTADGEMLAFSMIANNFLVSSKAVDRVQDSALEHLANFTREGPQKSGPAPTHHH